MTTISRSAPLSFHVRLRTLFFSELVPDTVNGDGRAGSPEVAIDGMDLRPGGGNRCGRKYLGVTIIIIGRLIQSYTAHLKTPGFKAIALRAPGGVVPGGGRASYLPDHDRWAGAGTALRTQGSDRAGARNPGGIWLRRIPPSRLCLQK